MKGYRSIAFGTLLAISGPALTYLAGIDWTQYVSPTWAPVIVGVISIGLRVVTTTPVGRA